MNSIKFKKLEEMIDRETLLLRTIEYTHSFKNLKIIRTFRRDI